jgi:hypothetical protein
MCCRLRIKYTVAPCLHLDTMPCGRGVDPMGLSYLKESGISFMFLVIYTNSDERTCCIMSSPALLAVVLVARQCQLHVLAMLRILGLNNRVLLYMH